MNYCTCYPFAHLISVLIKLLIVKIFHPKTVKFSSSSPGSKTVDAIVAMVEVSGCLSALGGFVGVGG